MTIRDAIQSSGLERLDAEVLLAHVLGASRSWLAAHDTDRVPETKAIEFHSLAQRRGSGEPIAYITGEKEFYARPFRVTPLVLIPRPSTEKLVDETLRFLKEPIGDVTEADSGISIFSKRLSRDEPLEVIDVGTGSGVIAITLKKEGWKGLVTAVDVSLKALDIAKENAARHGVLDSIRFVQGDGASVIKEANEPFLIVSNPPYIPEGAPLEKDVAEHEPHLALFAGEKGVDILIPLVKAARENPVCTGIILELRTDQVETVQKLLP